jgi:hypothetical protein
MTSMTVAASINHLSTYRSEPRNKRIHSFCLGGIESKCRRSAASCYRRYPSGDFLELAISEELFQQPTLSAAEIYNSTGFAFLSTSTTA